MKKQKQTRASLTDLIYRKFGYDYRITATIVDSLIEEMASALKRGETIELRNFGVFELQHRKSSIGRNISAGTAVKIPERYVVAFRPGKNLREAVKDYQPDSDK
ncbi:integration host factor subunit beta [Treponema phagedenis]|uniref:DNA-binding protein HU n=1 Tax=Treponema phagedenis TaxID=162 RepID=A0A0B7H1W1_TREPH|nr:HU family DNA-binding protein [Treponema phagedenis]EFW37399.1 DNA-binding protein HU [Treponema phagedenis F0421]NVP23657.1 integration host factor subunit beta [Treponema phagedenis]QEJ94508.1 integration host factor subunit beta [Treponema phagedenis]QEJ98783.1 integration host factor subunit beta [Treponema phagedenis]QEK01610.1 integration host factor subunit beta [Treponema phagedenis]